MREELKSVCHYYDVYDPVRCRSNPSFCTPEAKMCDGVANCPNGDDEDLKVCLELGLFSDLATFECEKKDVYNVTIMINAILCDGIAECRDEEDEKNCSFPDYILIVSLTTIIVSFVIFGYLLWKTNSLTLTNNKQIPTSLPNFEMLHGTATLKEAMFHAQSLENFEHIKSIFVDVEMKKHNGVLSEVVCCIKVSKECYSFSSFVKDVFSLYFCRIHLTHKQ